MLKSTPTADVSSRAISHLSASRQHPPASWMSSPLLSLSIPHPSPDTVWKTEGPACPMAKGWGFCRLRARLEPCLHLAGVGCASWGAMGQWWYL